MNFFFSYMNLPNKNDPPVLPPFLETLQREEKNWNALQQPDLKPSEIKEKNNLNVLQSN